MDTIKELDMFPYFYCANFIHKSMIIRNDSYPEEFSRDHPFASYISTMVACFAGNIMSNALLGLPIVDPWSDTQLVIMASIMWYLINYSPFDVFHKIYSIMPAELMIGLMVEIYRCNKIYEGINLASDKYSESPFVIIAIGTVSGNGIRFIEMLHRLVRGLWSPDEVEFMMPSCDTRSSLIASILFWKFYNDVTSCFYVMVLSYLIIMKLLCIWMGNPYSMVENLIYKLTIGVWYSLSGLVFRKSIEMPAMEIDVTEIIPDPLPAPDPIPEPDPEPPSPCTFGSAAGKRGKRSRSRSKTRRR